ERGLSIRPGRLRMRSCGGDAPRDYVARRRSRVGRGGGVCASPRARTYDNGLAGGAV
ncbi:MAG: hypothetical protein AVDCRST_MAG58-2832, partial [uncultured Rubrobacteraceae bacterium]